MAEEAEATSAAMAGATRGSTGMAATVIKDMAVIGPMPGMPVIPAIMDTAVITITTTTTTMGPGSRSARAS